MDKARRIAVQALVRQEESGFANLVLNAVLYALPASFNRTALTSHSTPYQR